MKKQIIARLLSIREGIYQSDIKNIRLQEYETKVKVDTYSYGSEDLQKMEIKVSVIVNKG